MLCMYGFPSPIYYGKPTLLKLNNKVVKKFYLFLFASFVISSVFAQTYKDKILSVDYGGGTWCQGTTRNITVVITNTGSKTWNTGGDVINIGLKWNEDIDYGASPNFIPRISAGNLAPGDTATYIFPNVAASVNLGSNNLTVDVVKEGACWFGNNNGGCGSGNVRYVTPAITIIASASISLTSAPGTNVQARCVNAPITDITYLIGGSGTGVNLSGLPVGIYGNYNPATHVLTISGAATTPGIYNYTISPTPCSSPVLTGTLTIHALPIATTITGGANVVCTGTPSVAFTHATPGGTWSVTNGTGAATITSGGVLTGTAAGTVTINYYFSNANGCYNTSTRLVTIVDYPAGSLSVTENSGAAANDNIICAGGSVTFTVTGSASNYDFKVNGSTVQSGPSNSFTTSILATGTQNISVVLSNNICQTNLGPVAITVNPLPNASLTVSESSGAINDNSICPGSQVIFSAIPGSSNYNFKVDGVSQQSGPSSTFTTTTLTNNQSVTVEVTQNGCTSISNPEIITVNSVPSGIFSATENSGVAANDNIICQGSSILFTAPAGYANYEFLINGFSQVSGASNTYSTSSLALGSSAVTVVVTNANDCKTTFGPINVTVNANPNAGTITGTFEVCEGLSTTLANAVSGGVWSSSNTAIAQISAGGVVTGISGGTVTIYYTVTTNGCPTVASHSFTVNALPAGAITVTENSGVAPNDNIICSGASIYFNAPAGYANYRFYLGALEVANGASNVWGTVLGANSVITVEVTTNKGCIKTLGPVNITVTPNPVLAAITGTDNVCVNNTISLSNSTAGGVWTSSNTAIATVNAGTGTVTGISNGVATIYYTYTNAQNCASTVSKDITVNPLPVITLNGPNPICPGSAGNVYYTEAGMSNYQWVIVGGVITAGGTNTDNTVTVTWNLTGTRTITVNYTNGNGCSAANFTTITSAPSTPAPGLTGPAPVCLNSTGNVYVTDAGKINYDWNISGGNITAGGTATDNTVTVTWTSAGTGTVSINYADAGTGCISANATVKNVLVHPLPTATISGTTTVCQNYTAPQITFTGSGGTIPYTFTFNINGGGAQTITTSVGSSVTYYVPVATPGVYNFNLVSVSDQTSCGQNQSGTATVTVTAQPAATISYTGGPFCTSLAGIVPVNRTGTPGGTYSATPAGLSINPANGAITPSGSAAGTYTVSYTVAAAGGCNVYVQTTSVTITQAVNPATAISYPNGGAFCKNNGVQNVTITGTAGGSFSATPAGLTINAATGAITPSSSAANTYTVTYFIAATGNCAAYSTTKSVTITTAPGVEAGTNMNICSSASNTNITGGSSATNYSSVIWSSSGSAGTISNAGSLTLAAYTPSAADIAAGSVTITLTANGNGACAAVVDTKTITIIKSATANAGTGVPTCVGAGAVNITAGASATNYSSVLWSGGAGVWTNANSLSNATYAPTAAEQAAGTVSLTLTAYGNSPCGNASSTKTLTINVLPLAPTVISNNIELCQNAIASMSASASSSAGSASQSSGTINIAIPQATGNSTASAQDILTISGIPATAVINTISVNFNITHPYDKDLTINLKAPNGNRLNLVNKRGNSGNNFTNTTINNTSTTTLTNNGAPFTGTFMPDASSNLAIGGQAANVTTFNGLFSVPNGNWTIMVRDNASGDNGTLNNWSITITYTVTNPVDVTWTALTDLYTDPAATNAYTGNVQPTVYVSPSGAGTVIYNATATNAQGCSRSTPVTVKSNPLPAVSLAADYCSVPGKVRITATATPGVTYQWSDGTNGTYIDVDEADDYYCTVTTAKGCQASASISVAQELVVNGDFSAGATGFTTGYTWVPLPAQIPNGTPGRINGLWPEGTYAVNSDAHLYHNLFYGKEHSTPGQTGNFLMINGKTTGNITIWEQTVNVKQNTDYYFSAWGMNLNPGSPARLQFEVNGQPTGTIAELALAPKPTSYGEVNINNWVRFYSNPTWNSGSATTATIRIVNLNTDPGGNDFGLDDISFGTLSTFIKGPNVANTDNQDVCIGAPINEIVYQVGTGGTGPLVTGLPPGVTATFNGVSLTIKDAPTVAGTYNYTVTTQGSCNPSVVTGVINVKPDATLSLTSANDVQAVCQDNAISPITYNVGGGATSATLSGSLPAGVQGNFNAGVFTISGTATQAGTFNFTVNTTGTCVQKNMSGTITVSPTAISGNITNKSICSGASGTLTLTGSSGNIIRWESSTDDGASWTPIANTGTTQPYNNITQTTIYRAVLKNGSCPEVYSTGGKVGIHNLWWGKYSTDWNNPLNWSDDALASPSPCPTIVIPVVVPGHFYPAVNTGFVTATNIDVQPGASLLITNDAILKVTGNLVGNGFNLLDGVLELNGNTPQTLKGSSFTGNTIKKIMVSNNVNIDGSAGNMVNVTHALEFGTVSNKTLTTQDNLTLKSTASSTASLGKIINNNNVSGDAIVERYIPAGKKWRFLSIPTHTMQSVKDAWMEGATSAAMNPNSGFGTQITSYFSNAVALGFDSYSPGGHSMKTWNENTQSYTPQANTGLGINEEHGYMIYIRGDRSSLPSSYTATAPVLRTKGPFKMGNTNINFTGLGSNQFVAVGNPYASAIDLRNISKSASVSDIYYVWDPKLGGSYGLGNMQKIIITGGSYQIIPGGASYATATGPNIESGSAFFAQTAFPGNGTIGFTEDSKVSGSREVLRQVPGSNPLIKVILETDEANTVSTIDGVLIEYHASYSNGVDGKDGMNMAGNNENLAIKTHGKLLSVERHAPVSSNDTIYLNMSGMRSRNYRFIIDPVNMEQPGLQAWLIDNFTQNATLIDLDAGLSYNFTVSNAAGAASADRFKIVFKSAQVALPVTFTGIRATRNSDRTIQVNWTVQNEVNIQQYEVERSADGITFTGILTHTAQGMSDYRKTDLGPLAGDNFYRIKAISNDGLVQYSAIAKVAAQKMETLISVYPNPVKNKTLQLNFEGLAKGDYNLVVLAADGKTIFSNTVSLMGNGIKKISLSKTVATGIYTVSLVNTNGETLMQNRIMIE